MAISRSFNNAIWHTKARGYITFSDWQSHLTQQSVSLGAANVFSEFFHMDGVGEVELSPIEIDKLATNAAGLYKRFAHADIVLFTTKNAAFTAASDLKTGIVRRCNSVRFRILNTLDEFDRMRDIYVNPSTHAWRDDLCVGHHTIDRQHQRLLALVRGLESEVLIQQNADIGRDELEWHLSELVSYAMEHFGLEQSLLEKHGYPQASEHSLEHLNMSGELLRLRARFRDTNAPVYPTEILAFFKSWVTRHILSSDMQAFTWIKENSPIWRFENRSY